MKNTVSESIVCSRCQREVKAKPTRGGNLRLPQAWKRHRDAIWCDRCWRAVYKLRAVTFPVAGIIDGDWPELRAAMRDAWGRSTALANWAVTELAKADSARRPGDVKLAKAPKVDLYKLWQSHWNRGEWYGAAVAANAIFHAVQGKYMKRRYDLLWTGDVSLPTFRYPYPYPVHNANWSAEYREHKGKDGHISQVPTVSVPLGGKRWLLRLKGGASHVRQLRAFAKIVNGDAVQGELAIYRQRTYGGGNGVAEPNGAAGSKIQTRIMVKMVAWLPHDGPKEREGTLAVTTTNNSFLVALMPGDEQPWRLHADDIRSVIKQHAILRQRLADDTKAEQRRPPRPKARYLAMLDERCRRCNNRIGSFVKEAASWLVKYAQRRKAMALTYDDKKRGYFPSFPWAAFRDRVKVNCEDAGIQFAAASGDVPETVAEAESNSSVE